MKLLPYAVPAIITAENINVRPNSFSSGRLSANVPPNQFPIHRLVIIIPINAVHTINDVPKYGATSREPASSIIIVAAPVKNDTVCNLLGIFDTLIHSYLLYVFGISNNITANNSSLPANIKNDNSHFSAEGSHAKFSFAPK